MGNIAKHQAETKTQIAGIEFDVTDKVKAIEKRIEEASATSHRPEGSGPKRDSGSIKDLADWTGSAGSPWAQWKWVFSAGLNSLRPGIARILDWAEEATKPGNTIAT